MSASSTQKEKILNGVRKACEKRPIWGHDIERLADDIEGELLAQGRAEVASTTIGDMVMERGLCAFEGSNPSSCKICLCR
jgi:transcriptional regulator NrdR family protein